MKLIKATLFVILTAFVPFGVKAELKTASVERLLQREFVGNVLIDDARNQAYFEIVDARGSSPARFPYAYVSNFASALKKIYVSPLDGSAEAKPLFEQIETAGYYFASHDPWSPDKRYLAIFKYCNGMLKPGVYDLKQSRARFFDVEARYQGAQSSLIWTSANEYIVLTGKNNSESTLHPHLFLVNGARAVAKARESGWREGEVTADVVGAGKYASLPFHGLEVKFAKINVRKNTIVFLEEAKFSESEISKVYTPEVVSDIIAVSGRRLVKGEPSSNIVAQATLSIINTSTGKRKIINSAESGGVYILRWSDSGRYMLVKRAVKRPSDLKEILSIVDTASGLIIEDLPHGAMDTFWIGDRLTYRVKGRQELLTNISFGSNNVNSGRIVVETIIPPALATTGDTGVFYLEDGDLWRIDIDGVRTNLTSDYPYHLSVYKNTYGFQDLFTLTSIDIKKVMPNLDELLFNIEETGVPKFTTFSSDGRSFISFSAPSKNSELLSASPGGAVFLTNSYELGSQLHYVDGASGEPVLIHHFNKQLADVVPAVGPIVVPHSDYDGREVSGLLYLPPGASRDKPKSYPMVMMPYPGTVYTEARLTGYEIPIWYTQLSFVTSMEVFAAQGFSVFLPSIPMVGKGEAGEPMTQMMPAIVSGLDAAIKTGFVDQNRLAVVGHSYGGYSALSVAAQTNRFNAIIAASPVSNIISEYGQFAPYLEVNASQTVEPGQPWSDWAESGQGRMGAAPWEDPDRYIRNSPLFFADQVKTPVMLIHGDLDMATMVTNSEEMFTALRRTGKDVVFIRYVGEQHTIEQPQNQRDMWERVFAFLKDNKVFSE